MFFYSNYFLLFDDDNRQDRIGTNNAIVVESVKTGEPKGYEVAGAVKPKSDIELRAEMLAGELVKVQDENVQLKQYVQELELKVGQLEEALAAATGSPVPSSKSKKLISDAKMMDNVVNG